jgi:5'-nucleotidase
MNAKKLCLLTAAALLPLQASALNIVLTNDDSWETTNIQVLKDKLIEAGHDVIMSAPCTAQSGKGGSITFLKSVQVNTEHAADDEYCVGDTDTSVAFGDFVEGSPVMSALYGIDVAAQSKWGKAPDLLISGPNEGNNVGFLNNNSGTLGAAMVSLARGIPAIAVSADSNSQHDPSQAPKIADIVITLVSKLEAERKAGEPLLPAYTGLNVNTPADLDNHQGYQFTRVGWNGGGLELAFSGDFSQDQLAMSYVAQGILAKGYATTMEQAMQIAQQQYAGKVGISFTMGDAGDDQANSEGVAVKQGYISISTIDANIQASQAKTALTTLKLNSLVNP